MHHAKVDSSDFGGVIINQTNGAGKQFTLNRQFFAYFSFNRILKGLLAEGKKRVVVVVDVPTNANGSFGNQTLFAPLFATNIVQDAFAIRDYDIRNDLFIIRVSFSLGAELESIVFLVKDDFKVTIHLSIKTLKNSQLLKE